LPLEELRAMSRLRTPIVSVSLLLLSLVAGGGSVRAGGEPTDRPDLGLVADGQGGQSCDRLALTQISLELQKAGRRREAAQALEAFSDRCGGDPAALRSAVSHLMSISEPQRAAAVASKLIASDPYSDEGFFLRGLALFEARDYARAVDDFARAIQLSARRGPVANASYLRLSRSLEQLGRPCDAILPLESLIAMDPLQNDDSRIRSKIDALAQKGRCATAPRQEEVFPLVRKGGVGVIPAVINGVPGSFLFDTGASYLSLSESFAARAGIVPEAETMVRLSTANGAADAALGRAREVQLRSLRTRDVPLVVPINGKGFGEGIDGLLGMELVSRFQVVIDDRAIRLRDKGAGGRGPAGIAPPGAAPTGQDRDGAIVRDARPGLAPADRWLAQMRAP
jgi:clan AA aspartic protease (TIGR02281 family)